MPSNKDLIKQIKHHANNLNMDLYVELDGLKNAELTELLSDIKAKWRDASMHTAADEVGPAEPSEHLVIAEGKSLTTKRGILGPGEEIKPQDLAGGEETLMDLYSKGYVVDGVK